MITTTAATQPPAEVTDEATAEGLRRAKEGGDAYLRMVDYFIANVAVDGAKKDAGNYIVGFANESAEPLYRLAGGQLRLAQPAAGENAHLEVVVADAADGRFVPGLTVHVALLDATGEEIGLYHLPFLWRPTMYHYGVSVHVPDDGEYTARVSIDVPAFAHHDKVNGKRYEEPVVVEFTGVRIETGSK